MEATFGARVRAMRIEARKTQDGLADALTAHGFDCSRRWVTGIEGGEFEPSLSALLALQAVLNVDVRYLLMGEQPGESEFLARLRGIEPDLDARGKDAVLSVAQQQAQAVSEPERLVARLRMAHPELGPLLDELAALPDETPAGRTEEPEEAPPPPRRRGRARA